MVSQKHYELIISEPPDQDPDSLLRGSVSGLKGGGTGQRSTDSNSTGAEFQRDFADRRSDDDTGPRWTRSTEERRKRRRCKKSAVAELPQGTLDTGPRWTRSTEEGRMRRRCKKSAETELPSGILDTEPRWTRSTEEGHKRRLRKKSAVAELPRGTPDGRCHDGIGPRWTRSTADGVSRNSIKWTRTPSCKRTRGFLHAQDQNKDDEKHRRFRLQSWKCPLCAFVTEGPWVYQRKSEHVKVHHPDEQDDLQLRPVTELVRLHPRTACLTWKCPGCAHGLVERPGTAKARAARLRPKELFFFPRCKNVENAHRATRTAGRLRNLLRAKFEGHRVEFLMMPWEPREGRTIVLCQRCLKRGRTVKALGECCPPNRKARTQVQSI